MRYNSLTPAVVIVLILVLFTGILNFTLTIKNQKIYHIQKFFLGYDFIEFFNASKSLVNGDSPYKVVKYVYPPLFSIMLIPLTYLPYKKASLIYSLLLIMSFFAVNLLATQLFFKLKSATGRSVYISVLTTTFLSFPFLFLLDRGNMEAFILLFLLIGMFFLKKGRWISGVFFSIALSIKAYPILIILPLTVFRKYKEIVFLVIIFLLMIAPTYDLWLEFLDSDFFGRIGFFRQSQNTSIVTTFVFFW